MEYIIVRKKIKWQFFLATLLLIGIFLGTFYYTYTYIDYNKEMMVLTKLSLSTYETKNDIQVAEWRFKLAFERYGLQKKLLENYVNFLQKKSLIVNDFYVNTDVVYYYNLLLNNYSLAHKNKFYKSLGLIYYKRLGKDYYQMAEEYLTIYTKKYKKNERVYFALYQIYNERNNYLEMEKIANSLYINFPDKVEYHILFSKNLIKNGKHLEAKSMLKTVVYTKSNSQLQVSSQEMKQAGLLLMSLLSRLKLMKELNSTYYHLIARDVENKTTYQKKWKSTLATHKQIQKLQNNIHREKVGGFNRSAKLKKTNQIEKVF